MNPLRLFQQAIRRLVSECVSGPIDIATAPQPLDPLTAEIYTTLLMAI
jgi:hypothetical protein